MGQSPTEEEIFQMISQVDDDNSGEIGNGGVPQSYRKPERFRSQGE